MQRRLLILFQEYVDTQVTAGSKSLEFDNAPQTASELVDAVLSNVNDKIDSGEIVLPNTRILAASESVRAILDNKNENTSATGVIPEITSAITDISEKLDKLYPEEDMLAEINTRLSHEIGKVIKEIKSSGTIEPKSDEEATHASSPPLETPVCDKTAVCRASISGSRSTQDERLHFEEIVRINTG